MRTAICLLLALFLLGPVAAQDTPSEEGRSAEAVEIVKKVDQAIKQVTSVRLEAKATPSGIAENFVSPAEGTAVLVGWNGSIPQKFYSNVKTTRPGSDEPLELTGGGDGAGD